MIKIKDFSIASKDLRGARALVPYTTPSHAIVQKKHLFQEKFQWPPVPSGPQQSSRRLAYGGGNLLHMWRPYALPLSQQRQAESGR